MTPKRNRQRDDNAVDTGTRTRQGFSKNDEGEEELPFGRSRKKGQKICSGTGWRRKYQNSTGGRRQGTKNMSADESGKNGKQQPSP